MTEPPACVQTLSRTQTPTSSHAQSRPLISWVLGCANCPPNLTRYTSRTTYGFRYGLNGHKKAGVTITVQDLKGVFCGGTSPLGRRHRAIARRNGSTPALGGSSSDNCAGAGGRRTHGRAQVTGMCPADNRVVRKATSWGNVFGGGGVAPSGARNKCHIATPLSHAAPSPWKSNLRATCAYFAPDRNKPLQSQGHQIPPG